MTEFRIVERDRHDMLGEGPLWSARRNAVMWVDILAPALHCLDLGDLSVRSWPMPEPIGWAVERAASDDLLIGLKSGFAHLSLEPFAIEHIGDPEPDRPHNRLNDAKVDRAGRLWTGSKDDREPYADHGALYRLDPELTWSRHDDGYGVTNGPAFSRDGSVFYHTDSAARLVYAFDIDAAGTLSNKRVFIRFEDEWGYPDGMTTDAEGGLWIAHWGGARISRFLADGSLDRSIALPASNITSIAFAGPNLDRMFVTSAAQGCAGEPHAGALFEVDAGVRGLPATPFAG